MEIHRIKVYLNNFFWLFLTYLLAPLFYFLIFFRKKRRRNKELKILIIQTGKIGDLACTTPVFREIKNKYPSAYISVIVRPSAKGILTNNPRIDEVIPLTDGTGISSKMRLLNKLRREKYDWAINFIPASFGNIIPFWSLTSHRIVTTHKYTGEIIALLSFFNNYRLEFKKHTPLMKHYLSLLKFLGIENPSEEREIFISAEEEKKALDFLQAHNLKHDDLLVGLTVTAGVKLKDWEPAKFAELANKLIEKKNAKIIFIGSVDDKLLVEKIQRMMQNNSVNSCGIFNLAELPALLKKLKLFISVDTGPLYIADIVGVPVVDIAGPVNVKELYPLNKDRSKIIQKDIYCVPCAYSFFVPRFCKEKHFRCLKEITVDDVFYAAMSLINNS